MRAAVLRLAAIAALLAAAAAGPAVAAEPAIRPAVDGILEAFETHPLVGLGDYHGLAEEGEFYRALIRDPRFADRVGNVVVEFASAAHQATLDRYLNGEAVPQAELRRVWQDVAAAVPTVSGLMYPQFLAEVRAVNLKLPRNRRIRVWAGEPPVDWSQIKVRADLAPHLMRRDEHAAAVIEREILARRRKALVIYGGLHFTPLPTPPGYPANPGLKGRVERSRPGAFYIVGVYTGFWQPDCAAAFEAETAWPPGSLVSPVRGSSLAERLLKPGCSVGRPPTPIPGSAPIPPADLATINAGFLRATSGADADALLYLGPAASLTRSPDDPDLIRDPALRREMSRRLEVHLGRGADLSRMLNFEREPLRPVTPAPPPAGPPVRPPAERL